MIVGRKVDTEISREDMLERLRAEVTDTTEYRVSFRRM